MGPKYVAVKLPLPPQKPVHLAKLENENFEILKTRAMLCPKIRIFQDISVDLSPKGLYTELLRLKTAES